MRKSMRKKILPLVFALTMCGSITVAAMSNGVVKNVESIKEIIEEVNDDGITVPFYSLEKTDNGYKVTYKELTENEIGTKQPKGMLTYEKTVKKTYSTISSVPESIYYSEYNNGLDSEFSGTLSLDSVVKNSQGKYTATYKGTLFGSGL